MSLLAPHRLMTQSEIDNHLKISERLLDHAYEQYEAGDLIQASEKAWGAVAHYLKSEAKFRGWRNRSHADLTDIAMDLAQETNEPQYIMRLYRSVSDLHQNFYEDWYLDYVVVGGIDDARELLDRLERRTMPQLEPRPSQVSRRRRR